VINREDIMVDHGHRSFGELGGVKQAQSVSAVRVHHAMEVDPPAPFHSAHQEGVLAEELPDLGA